MIADIKQQKTLLPLGHRFPAGIAAPNFKKTLSSVVCSRFSGAATLKLLVWYSQCCGVGVIGPGSTSSQQSASKRKEV